MLGRFVEALTPDWLIEDRVRRLIEREMQRLPMARRVMASLETSAYAEQNMADAKVFSDQWSVLGYALQQVTRRGLYLEFGVWSGQTINFIADRTTSAVHGFDSFRGLPEDWIEGYKRGTFDTSGRVPAVRKNVRLHVGWFQDVLPGFVREYTDGVAFLHVDCDLYSSTKTVFSLLGNRLESGCVIVFDDYFNYPGWQNHDHKAFQEFVREKGLKYRYLCYNDASCSVAVIIE